MRLDTVMPPPILNESRHPPSVLSQPTMSNKLQAIKATVVASTLVAFLGCQTTETSPSPDDYVWPRSDTEMFSNTDSANVARISVRNCDYYQLGKCDSKFKVAVVAIDGKRISGDTFDRRFVELLLGEHTVHVAVRWSNGAITVAPLQVDLEAGTEYLLYGYEVSNVSELASAKPAIKPPEPTTERSTLAEGVGTALFFSFGMILLPVLAPYAAVAFAVETDRAKTFKTATEGIGALPFEGCCWYWIEDQNGKVVAGEKVRAQEVQK
jgi:hypothetical protein